MRLKKFIKMKIEQYFMRTFLYDMIRDNENNIKRLERNFHELEQRIDKLEMKELES